MNHLVEYIVIGCYLLFLLAIGFAFRRFNSNVSDYFRNGCRGTWWLVGVSAFMSGISAYTFTGAAGVAFEAGWAVAIIYIGNALGYLVNFLFLAGWFRQLRAITAPEVIRLRFGPFTQQLYALTGAVMNILYAGLTLWALAIFSASVFGYRVDVVIVVLGLVVLFYSLVGGSWAVMATDFIQGMIMFAMTLLITILCLVAVGGIDGFIGLVHERGLSGDFSIVHPAGKYPGHSFTIMWAIAMILKQVWEHSTLIASTKYFGVKDGREARWAAGIAFLLMVVGAVTWFIPPMTARILFEEQVMGMTALNKAAESAFAVVSINLLPNGMIGLMVVAMFAATMSSIDTGLNRNAGIFIRDIYPALCRLVGRPVAGEKGQFILAQVCTLVFGALIIGTALYFARAQGSGMFDIMLALGAMLGIPLSVPLLLGLFVRRVPWWSAMMSIACGLASSLIATVMRLDWTFQQTVFINFAVGIASFLLTRPFWNSSSAAFREAVEDFFRRMHTPVDFEKEVGEANDRQQLLLIGGFVLAVAGFIALLTLLPNDFAGRLSILFVTAFVAVIGLAMVIAGRRRSESSQAGTARIPDHAWNPASAPTTIGDSRV